jgi:hypothetical protein
MNDGKRARTSLNMFFVEPTVGQPWPKPQSIQISAQQFAVHPGAFHFLVNSTSQTCDLLINAFDRYYQLIFYPQDYLNMILHRQIDPRQHRTHLKTSLNDLKDVALLKRLNIHIQQPCEQLPTLESDESCKVVIDYSCRIVYNRFSFLQIH